MEKFFNFNHLLKLFFVILAFNNIKGILYFFILTNIIGQISDSKKIAISGFQYSKNLFVKKIWSIGKNWWVTFLNLNFSNILDELTVLEVISIFFILLSFPQFQNDTSNIPREGDEIQYWQIGYGIYNSGEYRRIPISYTYTDQEETELGYRRGEPVYPFLIFVTLKTLNFNNSIDTSSCASIKCDVFDEEIFAISLFGWKP